MPSRLLSKRPSAYTRPRALCVLLVPRTAMMEFWSPVKRLRTARLGRYFSVSSLLTTLQLLNCSRVTVSTDAGRLGSTAGWVTLEALDESLVAFTVTAGRVISLAGLSACAYGASSEKGRIPSVAHHTVLRGRAHALRSAK